MTHEDKTSSAGSSNAGSKSSIGGGGNGPQIRSTPSSGPSSDTVEPNILYGDESKRGVPVGSLQELMEKLNSNLIQIAVRKPTSNRSVPGDLSSTFSNNLAATGEEKSDAD